MAKKSVWLPSPTPAPLRIPYAVKACRGCSRRGSWAARSAAGWRRKSGAIPIRRSPGKPGASANPGIVEVNLIAVRTGGGRRKQVVPARCPVPLGHASAAVRAGDLVFLSGLYAADAGGLIEPARPDAGFPYAGSSIRAQTEWVLDQADALCRAAGLGLDAVARQQLFCTDLRELDASWRALAARFGDAMPATSIVQVPAAPVPGCGVVVDMWAAQA